MTGSSSAIEFHPLPEDDPTQRQPVIDLAAHTLGWAPKIELEQGLRSTIENFHKLALAGS